MADDAATARRERGPVGIVLCGGASRRMGEDKALIGEPPWAHRVARTLSHSGCAEVELLGGDPRLAEGPWPQVPDVRPRAGPGAALLAAARAHPARVLVVAACDLPLLDAATVRPLIDAVQARAGVAVYDLEGRTQWSLVAISARTSASLAERGADGSPGLYELLGGQPTRLQPRNPAAVTDVDRRKDLPPGIN